VVLGESSNNEFAPQKKHVAVATRREEPANPFSVNPSVLNFG